MSNDPYDVLGVAPDADLDAIKARYRKLVRENHPDIAPDKQAANARMVLILDAWRTLSDPDRRHRHDERRIYAARQAAAAAPRTNPAPAGPSSSSSSTSLTHRAPSGKGSSSGKSSSHRSSSGSGRSHNAKARLLIQVNEAAQLYFREGRGQDAVSLCNKVLRADSHNVEATTLLGDIFAAEGDIGKAKLMYDRAIILEPNNLMIRRKRQSLRPDPEAVSEPEYADAVHPPAPASPGRVAAAPRPGLLGKLRAKLSAKG